MNSETHRPLRWLSTHPWLARFVGFEALVLAIAFLSLVLLENVFGDLFYAMFTSIAGLAAITAVVAGVLRYATASA